MNFASGVTYHFLWKDYELLAVFEDTYQGQPMFRECHSGLRFTLEQAGSPKITKHDETSEALKNYNPELDKFAPTFMGLREKSDAD